MRTHLVAGSSPFVFLYTAALLTALVVPLEPEHVRSGYLREVANPFTRGGAVDVIINVTAFVPLGWGLQRVLRAHGTHGIVVAVLVGAVLSVSAETWQYFSQMRYSSALDVFTNTVGTLVGGLAGQLELHRRFSVSLSGH